MSDGPVPKHVIQAENDRLRAEVERLNQEVSDGNAAEGRLRDICATLTRERDEWREAAYCMLGDGSQILWSEYADDEHEQAKKARAEVERLTWERDDWREACTANASRAGAAEGEVERLTRERDDAVAKQQTAEVFAQDRWNAVAGANLIARAEAAERKLAIAKGAFEKIRDWSDETYVSYAISTKALAELENPDAPGEGPGPDIDDAGIAYGAGDENE